MFYPDFQSSLTDEARITFNVLQFNFNQKCVLALIFDRFLAY